MKKTIFALLIILLFSHCDWLKNGITFYVNDSVNTTIPATTTLLPFDLPIPTVSTNATQEFQNEGVLPDQIQEVTLDNLVITITNPTDQTFSFLDAIYIYIQNSDGSNEQLIAQKENINSSAQSITLDVFDVNLADYLRQDSYKLRIKVKVKQILNHDVDLKIDLKFKVVAKL